MNALPVLRIIALKGRVEPSAVAESLGLPAADVEATCSLMIEKGWLKETPAGLRVMPEGREALNALLAEERAGVDAGAMAGLYGEFCALNAPAKQIFTRWQMTETGPNDHSDAAYDQAVLADLHEIHQSAVPLVERVAEVAPRILRYADRLKSADEHIAAGSHSYVTRPIIDSYHTVWFELHEDLIALAGLTREDEAAAGRAH